MGELCDCLAWSLYQKTWAGLVEQRWQEQPRRHEYRVLWPDPGERWLAEQMLSLYSWAESQDLERVLERIPAPTLTPPSSTGLDLTSRWRVSLGLVPGVCGSGAGVLQAELEETGRLAAPHARRRTWPRSIERGIIAAMEEKPVVNQVVELAQTLASDELRRVLEILSVELKHRLKRADQLAAMAFRDGDWVETTLRGRKLPQGAKGHIVEIRRETLVVHFVDHGMFSVSASMVRKTDPPANLPR